MFSHAKSTVRVLRGQSLCASNHGSVPAVRRNATAVSLSSLEPQRDKVLGIPPACEGLRCVAEL